MKFRTNFTLFISKKNKNSRQPFGTQFVFLLNLTLITVKMAYHYYKYPIAVISLLFGIFHSFGQGCPNANFSNGNFTNWTGFTGTYTNPGQTPGIVAGRHTIITTPGVDPFSCGGLSVLPPGGTTSARLGNSNTGAQGERLRYQMTVDQSNALFIYKYAVVLENPAGHTPTEQPEFSVRILNQSGVQIGGTCGTYTVYGGQAGQNFQTCGGVTWLPWTLVGVNLQPFIGQTIQVEFTTKDCSLSGHFGYAYVSAECMPLTLDVAYCAGSNNVTITAPPGFQTYAWSNGAATQSISMSNPTYGQSFSCTLTTFSNQGNCTVTVNAQVYPTEILPGFTADTVCVNTPTHFSDTTTINNNNTIVGWAWDFGDGGTSSVQNPTHNFTTPGVHTVQLIVTSDDNCLDTTIQQVSVKAEPDLQFTLQDVCLGDTAFFINQSVDTLSNVYTWFLSNGLPMVADTNTSYVYPNAGTYIITLFGTNSIGCSNDVTHQQIVHDKPPVNAGSDVYVCPNTNVTLAGSGADVYDWNNSVVDNTPFVPTASQQYVVTGTDAFGCVNTDTVEVFFFPTPLVDAGPDQEVCEGASVTFSGSGADSYTWTNGVIDGQSFVPGVDTIILTVTGTGANNCQATDDAILIVNPTPVVGAGPDQLICIGAQTVLSGTGADSYSWDNNVLNNIPFVPGATTTYTVTGTTNAGCYATDQVTVTLEPPTIPSFMAPIVAGCSPLDVTLSNTSSGTASASCVWEYGDGTNETNCGTVYHQYVDPGCYDVTLTTTTALGCVWEVIVPNYICVYPNPIAGFTPVPGVVSELSPISTMSNSSTGAVGYEWDFSDGSAISYDENPEHEFPVDPVENHVVQLVAVSDHGCRDTVTHLVIINEELIYYVPNAFTPDDDEFNQSFMPVFTSGFDPFDFNMTIYNRWGEIIFETNNHLVGWDGTYHGEFVKEGAYNWKIEFKTSINDERKIALGHVTILR